MSLENRAVQLGKIQKPNLTSLCELSKTWNYSLSPNVESADQLGKVIP